MDERVWRLPGPCTFVGDIVAEHGRGRHVATVLPESLAQDPVFTDSLAVALLNEFASQSVSARRVYDAGPDSSVLDAFCQSLIFDDRPVTIPDLLRHQEARDTVAVVAAPDLCLPARDGLGAFLQRVELETHAAGYGQRLSITAIIARGQLPVFAGGLTGNTSFPPGPPNHRRAEAVPGNLRMPRGRQARTWWRRSAWQISRPRGARPGDPWLSGIGQMARCSRRCSAKPARPARNFLVNMATFSTKTANLDLAPDMGRHCSVPAEQITAELTAARTAARRTAATDPPGAA